MTEIHPELARRALTLGRISAIAAALELDVGELITLAGLFEERLSSFARITVDGRFESLSILCEAPGSDSALVSEMRRREAPVASRFGEPVATSARRYLELTSKPGSEEPPIEFAVWELGRGADGIVGEIHRADGVEVCRAVGGNRDPDAREVFPAIAEKLGLRPPERQLLADVHPLLSRERTTMYTVTHGSAPALTIFYRDIATSDVIRLLVGLNLGAGAGGNGDANIGGKLGRFAGAAEASEIAVLELELRPGSPPGVRLSVELEATATRGSRQ